MNHYCVYTQDLVTCKELLPTLKKYGVDYDIHLNRTRFWLDPDNPNHMYVYLRYSSRIHCIDHETDYRLGV